MKRVLILGFVFLLAVLGADSVYYLNSMSQTILHYDTQTEELDNSFCNLGLATGAAPNKMTEADGIIYAVITYENSIQKIDAQSGESLGYIYLEDSSTPNDIYIENGFAYVTGNNSYKLYKIDLQTNVVVAEVQVGTAPEGIFPVGEELWVANAGYVIGGGYYEPGTISVLDPVNMEVIRTVSTGTNPRNGMLIDGLVHVACSGDFGSNPGRIDLIVPGELQAQTVLELGGTPSSVGYFEGKVFVGHNYPSNMHVYDADTFEILASPEDGYFTGGTEFGFSASLLYLIDPGDYVYPSWCRIYNTSDYSLVAEFEIGVGATDMLVITSGSSSEDVVVEAVSSFGNYPNPFNPSGAGRGTSTTISFELNTEIAENTEVEIFNMKGQIIKSLPFSSSTHSLINSITWNGTDQSGNLVSSGIYLATLKAGNLTIARHKMMLMK